MQQLTFSVKMCKIINCYEKKDIKYKNYEEIYGMSKILRI